jgi:hypothetical protein
MWIVSDEIIRFSHHSASQDRIVVGVVCDHPLNILCFDVDVLGIGYDVREELDGQLLSNAQFVKLLDDLLQNRF